MKQESNKIGELIQTKRDTEANYKKQFMAHFTHECLHLSLIFRFEKEICNIFTGNKS